MNQFNSLEQALEAFLTHDNNLRKQAEAYLDKIPEINFEQGIDYFLSGLDLSNSHHCELSAVYLKKKYIDDDKNMMKIPQQKVTDIIQKVQSTVNETKTLLYIKRACEILVKLYSFLHQEDTLMMMIKALSQNKEKKIKLALMFLIEIICEYSFDDNLLMKYSADLSNCFQENLQDADIQVRVAALKGLTVFLVNISDEKIVKKFEGCFPILLSKAIECIKEDEESGQIAIVSIVDLIEYHPKFIRPIMNDLLSLFTQIIQANNLQSVIRIQALQGINQLTQHNESLMRKNTQFKTETIQGIMQMMKEVENLSLEEWNKELDDQVLSKNDPSSAATEVLGNLGELLTVKFLLPLYIPLISSSLQSNDWQQQHAALLAIGQLSEGCKEFFGNDFSNLNGIMNLINPLISSQNPRILYDLLGTYSLLCTEFAPDIQQQFGDMIMNLVIQAIQEGNLLKVQFRAVQASINFTRSLLECDQESKMLGKYLPSLLGPFSTLIEKSFSQNLYILLEELLTALSVIASVVEGEFSKYYSTFMPVLKQILNQIQPNSQQSINIRVKCIESMGYFLVSIKNESQLFKSESMQIMQVLVTMQQQLTVDDAHHPSILVVQSQIASCMKEEFAQLMPAVFPKIKSAADFEIQAKMLNEEEEDYDKTKIIQKTIDLGIFGGKKVIQLNQALLEQKIEAFHCIQVISKSMGKSYFPYIEDTLNVIVKHFSFKHSKDIREVSIQTINNLLMACDTEEKMGIIMNACLPNLLKEFSIHVEVGQSHETIVFILKQFFEGIKMFTHTYVAQEHIEAIVNYCAKSLKVCKNLKEEIIKQYQDDEIDEELQEKIDDEIQEANEILQVVMDISGVLLKIYKGKIENLIANSILPDYFSIFQKKNATDNELNYAVCIFCELLEHCSDQLFSQVFDKVMPIYLNLGMNNQDIDNQQTCVFGIGIMAMRVSNQGFMNYFNDSLKLIQSLLEHKEANSQTRLLCTDNAIGALGKIAIFQCNQNQQMREQLLIKFISYLPLKNDPDESQAVHKILLQQLVNQNPALINSSPQTLQIIQKCVLDIKIQDQSNPENEILDDQGKQLLKQLGV